MFAEGTLHTAEASWKGLTPFNYEGNKTHSFGCGSKIGTLVSGNMDSNLRTPVGLIVTHTHFALQGGAHSVPSCPNLSAPLPASLAQPSHALLRPAPGQAKAVGTKVPAQVGASRHLARRFFGSLL